MNGDQPAPSSGQHSRHFQSVDLENPSAVLGVGTLTVTDVCRAGIYPTAIGGNQAGYGALVETARLPPRHQCQWEWSPRPPVFTPHLVHPAGGSTEGAVAASPLALDTATTNSPIVSLRESFSVSCAAPAPNRGASLRTTAYNAWRFVCRVRIPRLNRSAVSSVAKRVPPMPGQRASRATGQGRPGVRTRATGQLRSTNSSFPSRSWSVANPASRSRWHP